MRPNGPGCLCSVILYYTDPLPNAPLDFFSATVRNKTRVANDLTHRRHKKSIPNTKEFGTFLEKRQALKQEMEKIDAEHQARRNALIGEKKKAIENERKAGKAEEQSKL